MSVQEILTRLGEFGILVAAITWLAKKIITHQLSKDMEVFKAQLQKESQREIESLKSTLQQNAYEHQIRFSRMHEKRANVIEETYANLVDFSNQAAIFVNFYQSSDDAQKKDYCQRWGTAADKLRSHFNRHKIYFDKSMCEKIEEFTAKLYKATALLAVLTEKGDIRINSQDEWDEWEKSMDMLDNDVPPIKAALEQSFRELLGVIEPKKIVDASASKS
jgi:hypothetical protein